MASIVKRKSIYYVVYRHNGKQTWKKTGRVKHDADRIKTEIERRIHLGELLLQVDITFNELTAKWAKVHEGKVRPKTWEGYSHYLRRQILPYFADYPAKNINAESIDNFLSHCLAAGLAPQTVTKYFRLLKQILQQGVIWGYLNRNPGEYVKPPKPGLRKEAHFLTPRELQVLMEAALPQHEALISVACLTGMRRGELLALSWDDVDYLNNRLFVRKAVSGGKISMPKSQYSRRLINIPRSVMELLRKHEARLRAELPQNLLDLVFPNKSGNLMEHSSLFRYCFWPTLKRAGLPRIRFHDLRHSFASMLIHRGENIKYVQRVLGHSSVQVTIDVYGHLLPDVGREAAERLEEFFFPGTRAE